VSDILFENQKTKLLLMKSCPTLLLLISAGHQLSFTFAHSLRGLETQEYFEIQSLSDELCMTALSNDDVGVRSCDNGDDQQWYFNDDGTLMNKDTSKCADYDRSNEKVVVWKCHGRSNQKWTEDFTKLRSLADGQDKCMEVTDKMNIKVHECEDKPEQRFALPIDIIIDPDPRGLLIINSDNCVSSIGGDENNAELQRCETEPLDGFQRWEFTQDSKGSVENVDSGECLDVVRLNRDEPPMNVVTWKCNGKRNQQWKYDSDRRVFEIRSSSNKKYCLKAEHFGNLQADNCNGAPAQAFKATELAADVPDNHALIKYDGGDTDLCLEMGSREPHNVFIAKCDEENEQQMWFAKGDTREIINKYIVDDKFYCLDVRQSDLNVIAWPCHFSGNNNPQKNQQFLWDNFSRIRSRTGLGCFSINMTNKNVFLMGCHGGDNQSFYWEG